MVYAILQSMKTRDRMLTSTISLLRERGSNGVTVDAVLAHSGAPRGSVYHHFPGGREELLLASVERAGEIVSGVLEQSLSAGDTASAIDRFVSMWKKWLRDSDFRAGCPVLATAIDTSEAPLQDAVRKIFQRWHDDLLRQLVAEGCPRAKARRLATMIVASIEGALVLARTQRDVRPLNDVTAELHLLLRSAA